MSLGSQCDFFKIVREVGRLLFFFSRPVSPFSLICNVHVASHGVTVATFVWFKEKLEEGFLSFFFVFCFLFFFCFYFLFSPFSHLEHQDDGE